MFTTQGQAPRGDRREEGCTPAEAALARDVLGRLGEPDGLHAVRVKPVSGSKYWVNVYVRAAAASYRVAHSYFVEADGDGRVLASSPAIARLY
jgi:hypothetical protein